MKENVVQLDVHQESPTEGKNHQPISEELQEAIEILIERLRNQDPIGKSTQLEDR